MNIEIYANLENSARYMKASSVLVQRNICLRISEIVKEAIEKKGMIVLYEFRVSEEFFKFNGIYDKDKGEVLGF